jgi:tetratricopeptide (TPR) repeat protein
VLGDAFAGARQYDFAYSEYDTAIKLDPRNPRAYEQAGNLAFGLGDLVRAEKYYSLGRKSSPDDVGLLIAEGDLFVKLKRYGEARADYVQVERLAPSNAEAAWRVGDVDMAVGRQVQALNSYGDAAAVWLRDLFR